VIEDYPAARQNSLAQNSKPEALSMKYNSRF
jgi:hypothetical protein